MFLFLSINRSRLKINVNVLRLALTNPMPSLIPYLNLITLLACPRPKTLVSEKKLLPVAWMLIITGRLRLKNLPLEMFKRKVLLFRSLSLLTLATSLQRQNCRIL